MKRLMAWPLFHLFFWTGDLTSRFVNLFATEDPAPRWYESTLDVLVNFYCWCMRQSLRLDNWADLQQWRDAA